MDLLAAMAADRLVPRDAVCVLLVGSRARGWQHARSDLDVVVVTTSPGSRLTDEWQPVAPAGGALPVKVTAVDGVRCEVNYWTDGQIRAAIDKVSWPEWDVGRAVGSLSADESLLAERLPHAIALLGDGWLDAVVDSLRSSAAFSCLSLTALTYADRSLEDVSGLWESGDIRGAVLAAQRAFVRVTDALTASMGVPGTDAEWRLRRVEAASTDVLAADEFWRLTMMLDFDADHPERWLDYVTFRCSQIMLDIRLGR